ncbi:DNA polymerase III subunit alpha [Candidatus Rhabdochlamydia oedothoracis]|uniref:DNA polymerase III subunit alpha n=1 Tax=Candidatus Rhabdochlamydia oedothoracis TaxID=2720720 RepID=A0ABX8V061_9BACT|nr:MULTISPECIES: DNA polymerase III subunit alpha [Rhabdochlamydia]KAG6558998.1 DNA polymerase III subunit alpha [Candidatus Rhabdochlamydia sp. W815]MCL6755986.1 DNA polymerase III subunit alpha [Candidatus Rhabdochlamydia oedothoracis]QYF48271.1 DNA polymerase III subunit alpha [Candidatus Rhabdochlamydia oedothoracis]
MNWNSLHTHSQYSILNATASIESLVAKAAEHKMTALALTDQNNMYGTVEFFKACIKENIKPIIGCELYVAPESRFDKKRYPGLPHGFPIILLAKDSQGYQNLCKLSSLAHLEGFYYTPRIDRDLLAECAKGLICLSGPFNGILGHYIIQKDEEKTRQEIAWFQQIFGSDYYFELQRHQMQEEDIRSDGFEKEGWLHQLYLDSINKQNTVNQKLIALSSEMQIPLVATNNIHYIHRNDWNAHEILMNVQSGEPCEIWEKDSFGSLKQRVKNPKRQVNYTHELYFKSSDLMCSLFADIPSAIEETYKIADKCNFSFDFKAKYYPVFTPPQLEDSSYTEEIRQEGVAAFLRQLCEEGIVKRYTNSSLAKVSEKYPGRDPLEVVKERLEYELNIILSKGMADYLLIVWDFISWAKKKYIPVGPGRGSGAGSIILYLIEVTDIEPLRFDLFFERFINPERVSYPDIDVDICMDRRSEVIDYTVGKYGKDKVAQIITFGTMKAKMAIKDVGRVLSVPLARVNEIAKLIPEDLNMTLSKALEIDPELRRIYQEDKEIKQLIDIAKTLEGSVRNTGVHAAGIIISADPLMQRIPLCSAKDSDMAITQFSMKPVEQVGMLKIDFLGLKTLTSIQHAVDAIKQKEQKEIDWVNLNLENEKTFALLNQGKTTGIFQLESAGMQDLARQLHIDKFEEIIAVGALYRPGPMEMIPSFINRKHGKESIEIDHLWMEDILSETYGIMVYQEQVMQIASRLAGYSLGEGDVLRRAMGKKDKEEMFNQREKFRLGAIKNNLSEEIAMRVFDKIEKFASYGFNKSHAAAYGYLSYVTAYLKANYPGEWMAALMTSDCDDLSKVTKHIRESQKMDIAILPPDINESGKQFLATKKGIRFAMGAIKGVGEGVVDVILKERLKGNYKSLFDFIQRIDTSKVGKKVMESLVEAGCFDFTKFSRAALLASVDPMFNAASKGQKEAAKGIMSLFDLLDDSSLERTQVPQEVQELPRQAILRREYELLGVYLHEHPLDEYRTLLKKLSCVSLVELADFKDGPCRITCIIEGVAIKVSAKNQRKFAILKISDNEERFELPIWSDLYEQKASLMVENQLLYAIVHKETTEGQIRLQCRWLDDLTRVDEAMIQACDLAYTQAKQFKPVKFREKNKNSAVEKKQKIMRKLKIFIESNRAHLSHILLLKTAFRSHSGQSPVEILFTKESKHLGVLLIEQNWGVEQCLDLENKIRSISSIDQMHWE